MDILKNLKYDILKSRRTPLLIELSKKNLDAFGENGLAISLATTQAIYNRPLKNTEETNVIFIDADDADNFEHTYLLEEFLNLIADQVENIRNLAIVNEVISSGLSFATGGLLDSAIGDFINNSVELVIDSIGDDFADYVVDATIEYVDIGEKTTDILESKIFDFINDKSTDLLDRVKDKKLYLSPKSKKAIKELSDHFKESLTPAEAFRFVLELMLSVAIDMPTVLYIKNPHKLDKDSLAILSLLFSYSKDIKDQGSHTGLSVVYAYEDKEFQPYGQIKDEYRSSKKLLDEQRHFAQRYSMLERPTSDIPKIAVKSSMFVGRAEELENLNERYSYSKNNKDITTLETISGEPGVGKTKLVKKHLEQIRKNEPNGLKQIQLTLLNQVGHSSSNTGLSSLIDSVIKEANRLESVKTFQEKIIDKTKDYTKGKIANFIKDTLGINRLINIGAAINDRMFLDGQMEKAKLDMFGDLDNKSQDKKQQQFTSLNTAIKKLQELSDDYMPIVLFIDDLQWIDEDSSEYLLQQFINQFNVHIVATIRPSDATTVLKKAVENKSLNQFKIALLKKVGIKIDKEIVSEINTDKLEFHNTHLLGFDAEVLKSLISQVIKGDETQQAILADTIIDKLTNDMNKETVNTLFAIETINMLCDEKLYSLQDKSIKIDRLILTDTDLRFNKEIKNFKESLDNTFEILNKKYQDSLSHYHDTTDDNRKFNLMAYAVLEERLNILKIYFNEYGNAAVNTLLFSSLLGTPFNSTIVKNILESISTTNEKLLQPLKEYILDGKNKVFLAEAHYEIIEEVYEILSRYVKFDNSYEYKHSLLNIFLDKQLDYQLSSIFINDITGSKDRLYELILVEINNEKDDLLTQSIYRLTQQEINEKLFYENVILNILEKGYKNHKEAWEEKYISNMFNLSNLYLSLNYADIGYEITTKCYRLLKELYEKDNTFEKDFVGILGNLAIFKSLLNKYDESEELYSEQGILLNRLFKEDAKKYFYSYTNYLMNYGLHNANIGLLKKAKSLFIEYTQIFDRFYKGETVSFNEYHRYLNTKINLAVTYTLLDDNINANKEYQEVYYSIANQISTLEGKIILTFVKSALGLIKTFILLDDYDKATEFYNNFNELFEMISKGENSIYLIDVLDIKFLFINLLIDKNKLQEAKDILDEIDYKIKKEENIPLKDLEIRSKFLRVIILDELGHYHDAININNDFIDQLRSLNLESPIKWTKLYISQLYKQASLYYKIENYDSCYDYFTKGLELVQILYSNDEERYEDFYADKLLETLEYLGNMEQFIEMGAEALSIKESKFIVNENQYDIKLLEEYIKIVSVFLNTLLTRFGNYEEVKKIHLKNKDYYKILHDYNKSDEVAQADYYLFHLYQFGVASVYTGDYQTGSKYLNELLKIYDYTIHIKTINLEAYLQLLCILFISENEKIKDYNKIYFDEHLYKLTQLLKAELGDDYGDKLLELYSATNNSENEIEQKLYNTLEKLFVYSI